MQMATTSMHNMAPTLTTMANIPKMAAMNTVCAPSAMLVFGWVASACVDMMRVWHACVRVMRACAYSLGDTLADLAV